MPGSSPRPSSWVRRADATGRGHVGARHRRRLGHRRGHRPPLRSARRPGHDLRPARQQGATRSPTRSARRAGRLSATSPSPPTGGRWWPRPRARRRPLDVLVNNAGNMYRGPIAELDEAQLLAVFHTNVVAGMMLTQAALDHLDGRPGAAWSSSARCTRSARSPERRRTPPRRARSRRSPACSAPSSGRSASASAACGPAGCSPRSTSAPAWATTPPPLARLESLAPAHALGRLGTVTEVAEAIEYLARAEWTTGNVLTVDGGLGLGVTNA